METVHPKTDRIVPRPPTMLNLAGVLATVLVSTAGAAFLPGELRIRWHIGTYDHWGPETVAAEPLLLAFPLLATAGAAAVYGRSWSGPSGERSRLLDVVLLAWVGLILLVQLLVLGLNVVAP